MRRCHRQQHNYKKGFTFIEVLASLIIMSIALVPILTWLPTSLQAKLKTERKTTTVFLAQNKIEELHYQIISNFDANYNKNNVPFNPPYQDYRYTITANNTTANLKTISVKVWHIDKPNDDTAFYTQVARR